MIKRSSAMQEGVLRDIVEILSDNVDGIINPSNLHHLLAK